MIDRLRTWLKKRRRLHLEREARELEALIREAHQYARYNGFIASVLAYRRRKGFITPKQHHWLKVAVKREYLIAQGA
jgi:hypothetical protein